MTFVPSNIFDDLDPPPTVPLVVLQCLLRAIVLLSIIPTAADKVHAAVMGAEALILVAQVAVFVMMDAMRIPTPVLRIGFALALIINGINANLASKDLRDKSTTTPVKPPTSDDSPGSSGSGMATHRL